MRAPEKSLKFGTDTGGVGVTAAPRPVMAMAERRVAAVALEKIIVESVAFVRFIFFFVDY